MEDDPESSVSVFCSRAEFIPRRSSEAYHIQAKSPCGVTSNNFNAFLASSIHVIGAGRSWLIFGSICIGCSMVFCQWLTGVEKRWTVFKAWKYVSLRITECSTGVNSDTMASGSVE